MRCYYPISLQEQGVQVPCGKCIACLQKKRNDWSFRLMYEQHNALNSSFVTITYDQDNLPILEEQTGKIIRGIDFWNEYDEGYSYRPTLLKTDVQKFIKRVRKYNPFDLKYYLVGEYGENTKRPHYHAIIYNIDKDLLQEKWNKGFTRNDLVTQASIHYVTKYMISSMGYYRKNITKKFIDGRLIDVKPANQFALMSKGLGKDYAEINRNYHIQNRTTLTKLPGGQVQMLPRYLQEKIFNPGELDLIKLKDHIIRKYEEQKDYDQLMDERKIINRRTINKSKSKKL